jgi:type III restriction enzyme
MQEHYWEESSGGYEVKVSKGYTDLKPSSYTYQVNEPLADYRVAPADKSNMAKYLFGGFERCLYPVQKFDADAERKLAAILERDAIKWFKPARGQFQIYYRNGADHLEYQPDFVAETADTIYMLEPKMRKEMDDPIVLAKKDAAINWCENATSHVNSHGDSPPQIMKQRIAMTVSLTPTFMPLRVLSQRASTLKGIKGTRSTLRVVSR